MEDYFQVSAFEGRVARKDWGKYDSRVEVNTDKLLSVLAQHHVRATFFVLGWIADRFPALVKRIHGAGHEIGSHGYWHRLIFEQTPEEFDEDIKSSKEAIANACGVTVTAYRAPSFSIVERSLWALDVLIDNGIRVDSSIFPIRGHDRYGIPGAKREVHTISRASGSIMEFPPSAFHSLGLNIPIGGGYFRILPLAISLAAIAAVQRSGRPAMFYIHPWELDSQQPRVAGIGAKSRFRHYCGLQHTEARLHSLLKRFAFDSLQGVLDDEPTLQTPGQNVGSSGFR